MKSLLIKDCRVDLDSQNAPEVSVLIEDGRIKAIDPTNALCHANQVIEAGSRYLVPGFIDVHMHGAGGAEVLDSQEQSLRTMAQTCARFGVTGFLATSMYKPNQSNTHLSMAAQCVGKDLGGATLLGIHLEGPFVTETKRGMIQLDCLYPPDSDTLSRINTLCQGHLSMMVIAPELPGALPLVESLVEQGTIASLGHTNATYEQTLDGFSAGIRHVTHLFNAMPSLHHRNPGPLAAIFNHESVTAQIISDGVHIHPAMVKLAITHLGPDRVLLITDGIQAMGLPDGHYRYNDMDYESSGGTARYHDGTLIGTTLGLSHLVKRAKTYSGCSLQAAIQMVTQNPAKLLGLDHRKGTIEVGRDADLVLLNRDLSVHKTCVAGRIVYSQQP